MSRAFHRPLLSASKTASLCHHSPGEPQAQSAVPKHTDPIWSGFRRELSKPRPPLIHHFCVHLHFIYWCQRFTHVANHNAWGQWCHQMLLIYKREQVLGNAGKTRWQLFMTRILRLLSFQQKLLWALHSTTSLLHGSLWQLQTHPSVRTIESINMWHQNSYATSRNWWCRFGE